MVRRYQQGRLASSVTGTPGIDNSAAQMFGAAAQAADGISSQLAAAARDNQFVIARAAREQAQVAKAQKKLLDDVDVATYDSQWQLAMRDRENKVKTETQQDPGRAAAMFQEQSAADLDKFLEGITDENIRARVQKSATQKITGRIGDISGWSLTQRTNNAQANLTQTLGEFSKRAGSLATVDEYEAMLGEVQNLIPSMTFAFGAKTPEIVDKIDKDIAKNFITGQMMRDHLNVKPMLESGRFNNVLDAQEQRQLLDDANRLEKAEEKKLQYENRLGTMGRRVETAVQVSQTDFDDFDSLKTLSLDLKEKLDFEKNLPEKFQDMASINQLTKEIRRTDKAIDEFGSEKRKDAAEKAKTLHDSTSGVQTRLKLTQLKSKIGATEYGSNESALEDLERLERSVDLATNKGYLNESEQKTYLGWLTKKRTKLEQAKGNGGALRMLGDLGDALFENAARIFGQAPPAPGKTAEESTDARLNAYDQEMEALKQRYRDKYNREPDDAILRKMDTVAKQAVAGG